MMREVDDGIVLDDAREHMSHRWYFSAARVARALQSQGLSPDGAASIVGQMIEDGLQAMPHCPKCNAMVVRSGKYTDCTNPDCGLRTS